MKKLVLLLFILLVNLISIASAVEIKLSKETYAPSETLQAEIYGNFIDGLKVENIYFYRERNLPVVYDLLKTEDKFILYAILPSKEGDYTIKIENTRYETDTGTSTSDIIKEFQIKQANTTILTINPGFVIATDDFYIKVKANANIGVEAELEETGEKQTVSLVQNKEEKIYFSISEIQNYTETNIKVQNYLLPTFIFPKKTQIMVRSASRFRFNPPEINAVILEDESYFFKVFLLNVGDDDIENIKLSSDISDLDVEIIPSVIPKLETGEKELVNITFSSEKEGTFSGAVFASSENISAELGINMEVTENKSEISYEGPSYESCADVGKICTLTQRCTVPVVFTDDGYCCPEDCVDEKKEKSTSWIYGVIIIVALIAGLIFFSRYMKKKKQPDTLKKRTKQYEERISGTAREVRGSLTKV